MRKDLAPLRHREFRLLFAGRTTSLVGGAMAPVALAFAVLEVTGSKTDLGLVLAAREIPLVLFLLAGGIWADRLPRNVVMVGANLLSAVAQAGTAALLLTGTAEIWHLAALAAVNGSASAFYFPASAGVIPQTVPAPLLQQANALLGLSVNGTQIGGAALGGLLVAAFSPGAAIAVDAVTYVLAGLFLAQMRLGLGAAEARSFFTELAAGWHEFRSRTWLWAIVAQFSLMLGVVIGSFSVLGPVVADEELGGAAAWGLVLTANAVGFLAGGVLGLRWRPRRMLLVATLAILLMPLTLVALGFPLPLYAIVAAAFVGGFGIEIFGLLWNTTMQQEIPPRLLSRVYSYDALGSFVLVPVGLALAGPVAELIGVRATLWGAAAIAFAVTLAVLAVRDVRTLQRRSVEPEAPVPATSSP